LQFYNKKVGVFI